MKKSLISLVLGASMAFGVAAQDQTGGDSSSSSTMGGLTTGTIATGVVAAGVLAAVVSNNRGSSDVGAGTPTCNDGDNLVDGVCVGTTTTLTNTLTLSGTQMVTITVPTTVTVTYAPTVQ